MSGGPTDPDRRASGPTSGPAGPGSGLAPAGAVRLVRAAAEEVRDRVQAVTESLRTRGQGAIGPPAALLGDAMASFQRLVENTPTPGVQLELVLHELRAKRAAVRAMQEQLTSFDRQLEVLEASLEPLAEWNRQWGQVQSSVVDSLRAVGGRRGADPSGGAAAP